MKLIKIFSELSISRIAILALLSSLSYFFSSFDGGGNLNTQIESANATVASETARRVGIEKTMKKEEEMKGNLLQLQRSLDVVKSKIPFEFKDTQMSMILNGAALSSGVNVVEITANPTVVTNTNAPQIVDPSSVKPEDLIEEVKFNITINGSYDAFLKFLDALTKEDKVIKVRNFAIEKNSTNIDDDNIKFKGEVVGFKQAAILARPQGGK